MLKLIPYLFVALLITSCYTENKPSIEVPENLMTEEMIILVLTDLQIAEGVIAHNRLGKAVTDREFKDSIYQVVFDHYEITVDDLNENLDFYNTDIERMEKIYDEVLVNLSKYETEIRLEGKANDSIPENDEK